MINETLLKKWVSDDVIFGLYLGDLSVGEKISSPLRTDPIPSFCLWVTSEDDLIWRDFGNPGRTGGDAISFVQELFSLPRKAAVEKIWNDYKDRSNQNTLIPITRRNLTYEKGCRAGRLEPWELSFWNEYGANEQHLRFWRIYGNRGFWVDDACIVDSKPSTPSYVYVYGEDSYKIYTPNTDMKFYSHSISGVIEGWDQLYGGGPDYFLVLCSGLKDCISCWLMGQFFFGGKIVCIAPTTEKSKRNIKNKLPYLINRYPNRYVWMDFDSTGWSAMRDWKETFTPLWTEPSWNQVMIKDLSEINRLQGIYTLKEKFTYGIRYSHA